MVTICSDSDVLKFRFDIDAGIANGMASLCLRWAVMMSTKACGRHAAGSVIIMTMTDRRTDDGVFARWPMDG